MGPVGASRVGFIDGKYVLNPSKVDLEKSKLDLVVAGTKDAVLMVESEANGLTEEEMGSPSTRTACAWTPWRRP